MKKLLVILPLLTVLWLAIGVERAFASIIISEFTPTATTEWVELLNTDQNSSASLSGYSLKDGSGATLKTLTGTLPRGGFLTFTLDSSLSDTGGLIRLVDSSDTTVSSVSYGTDTSVTTIDPVPTSAQSAYYNLDGNAWETGAPTKGWCNPGSGSCPTISTITSQISAEGVSTNLGDQTDYSRTSGLYFEKIGYGRIEFLAEINFTDRDALSWMQTLDQKLDMSVKARIALDADLIRNLVSTQARLTMYGLTFSNPRLLVDGHEDTEGIISGLSYSNGNLIFTAAHFTVFTAVESSSTSTSITSAGSPPGCGDRPPGAKTPHLYLIKTTRDSAALYFTPADDPVSYYYLAYGLSSNDNRFGVSFSQGSTKDVISYKINDLLPATNYYFKVRAGNGCSTGGWSNELMAKTEGEIYQLAQKPALKALVEEGDEKPAQPNIVEPTTTPLKTLEKEESEVVKPTEPFLPEEQLPLKQETKEVSKPNVIIRILQAILRLFSR